MSPFDHFRAFAEHLALMDDWAFYEIMRVDGFIHSILIFSLLHISGSCLSGNFTAFIGSGYLAS